MTNMTSMPENSRNVPMRQMVSPSDGSGTGSPTIESQAAPIEDGSEVGSTVPINEDTDVNIKDLESRIKDISTSFYKMTVGFALIGLIMASAVIIGSEFYNPWEEAVASIGIILSTAAAGRAFDKFFFEKEAKKELTALELQLAQLQNPELDPDDRISRNEVEP